MKLKLILLTLFSVLAFSAMAQRAQVLYIGTDTIKTYNFYSYSPHDLCQRQQGIVGVEAKTGTEYSFTPGNTQSIRVDKVRLEQCHFVHNGDSVHAFLEVIYSQAEGFTILRYYTNATQYVEFIRFAGTTELISLTDDPAHGTSSPLRQMLYQYPLAQDARVRAVIDSQPSDARGLLNVARYLRPGGYAHFPHLRWGVTAGYGMALTTAPGYDMDWGNSIHLGLFADIPVGISSLTIHPELLYTQYGSTGVVTTFRSPYNSVACNQRQVSLPLLLRYCNRSKSASILPYIELGLEPGIALSQSFEYRFINGTDGAMQYFEGSESMSAFTIPLVGGGGVEWILPNQHSFFTGLRAGYGFVDYSRIAIQLSVAYSL